MPQTSTALPCLFVSYSPIELSKAIVTCGLDRQLPTTNQTVNANNGRSLIRRCTKEIERRKKSAVRSGLACKFLTLGTYLHAPNQTNTNANAHANLHSNANKPSSPPIHLLLKLDSLTLLLPPSPLSASPPAVVGESTDVGSRASVGATVSARAADGVIAAHGAAA